MSRFVLCASFVTAALLASAPVWPAFARDGATIVNSGSTNTAGFRINVWSDGDTLVAGGAHRRIPRELAATFFANLNRARAQESGAGIACMKSASFGTTQRVLWHGWQSRDLGCPTSGASNDVARDTAAIVAAVGSVSGNSLRHTLPVGRRLIAEPSPAPTPS